MVGNLAGSTCADYLASRVVVQHRFSEDEGGVPTQPAGEASELGSPDGVRLRCVMASFFFGLQAFAVHDLGLLELDGNVADDVTAGDGLGQYPRWHGQRAEKRVRH
jgi:hypothetical protein